MAQESSFNDVHSANDETFVYEFINRRGGPNRDARPLNNQAVGEPHWRPRAERDPWLEITDGSYSLQENRVQSGSPHTDIAVRFFDSKEGRQVTPEAGWIDIWYEAMEDKFFKPEKPETGGVKGRIDATEAGRFAQFDASFHLQPIIGARITFEDIIKRPDNLPVIHRSKDLPVNADDKGAIAKLGLSLKDDTKFPDTDPVRMYVVNGENDDIGDEAIEFFGQPQYDPKRAYAEFDVVVSGGKYWVATDVVAQGEAPGSTDSNWADRGSIDLENNAMIEPFDPADSYVEHQLTTSGNELWVAKQAVAASATVPAAGDDWDDAGFVGDITAGTIRGLGNSTVSRVPNASNQDIWYDAGASVPAYRQGTNYSQFAVVEYGTYAYVAMTAIDGAEQERENANPKSDVAKWHRLIAVKAFEDEYLHTNPGLQVVQIKDFEAGVAYPAYSVVKYNGKYWAAKKDIGAYAEASRSIGIPDVSSLGQVDPWKVVQGEEQSDWRDSGAANVAPPNFDDSAGVVYNTYDVTVSPDPTPESSNLDASGNELGGSANRLGHTLVPINNDDTGNIATRTWLTIPAVGAGTHFTIVGRPLGVVGGNNNLSSYPRKRIAWADIRLLNEVTANEVFSNVQDNEKIDVTFDLDVGGNPLTHTVSIMKIGTAVYIYARVPDGETESTNWRPAFYNETVTDAVAGGIYVATQDNIAGDNGTYPDEGVAAWHDTGFTTDDIAAGSITAWADGVFAEFALRTRNGRLWVATGDIAAGDLAPGATRMIEAADLDDIPVFDIASRYTAGSLVKLGVVGNNLQVYVVTRDIAPNTYVNFGGAITDGIAPLIGYNSVDNTFANLRTNQHGLTFLNPSLAYDANAAYVQYSVLLQGGKLYYAQIAVDASNTVEPGGETGLTELGRFRFVGINATAGGVTNRAVFTPLNINISNLENSADFKFYQVASLNGSISGITPQSTTVGDILGVNPIVPGDEYEVAGSDTSGFAIGIPHGTGNSLLVAHDGNGNLYGTALTPADNDVIYSAIFRGPDLRSFRLTGMIGAMGPLKVIVGEDEDNELFAYLQGGTGTRRLVTVIGNMTEADNALRKAALETVADYPVYAGFNRGIKAVPEDIDIDRALDRIIRAQDAMRARVTLRRWKS